MSEKRAPGNTATEHDPASFLAESMFGGTSRTIERQEKRGQSSFVQSDTLPTEMNAEAKAVLETLGVKFTGPVDGDPLFQYAELPDGWKKVGTDHDMWSDLVNEQGEKVAAIFYKAAFYDRRASLSLARKD